MTERRIGSVAGSSRIAAAAGGGGGASEIAERVEFSGVSTVDITGFDSAKFDHYTLYLTLTNTTASTLMKMRTSTDGGSTFDSGATDYDHAAHRMINSLTTYFGQSSTGDNTIDFLSSSVGTAADGEAFNLILDIIRPQDTNKTSVRFETFFINNNTDTTHANGAGARISSADVDAIQIIPSAGVVTGVYTLIGIKNA